MDDKVRPIRHASEFWDYYGATVQDSIEPGDLIFFSRHGFYPTHIGIVRNEESYIHAPGNANTKVELGNIALENISADRGGARRLFATNPIGFKAPTVPHDSPSYRYHQQLCYDE